jgi:catechol 2,3-dioxygenase-like lactoylglutathione lyase family enzyme
MLGDKEAIATIAVRDLTVAAKFYGDTLGLKRGRSDESGVLTYTTGKTTLFVYPSKFAGTNQATAVTWMEDDKLEETVRTLKGRGVVFEHYDFPGTKVEGDVHIAHGQKMAWFKDPDGNIHAILGR